MKTKHRLMIVPTSCGLAASFDLTVSNTVVDYWIDLSLTCGKSPEVKHCFIMPKDHVIREDHWHDVICRLAPTAFVHEGSVGVFNLLHYVVEQIVDENLSDV